MALDELLAALRREAQEEADRILADARREAEEITHAADVEAEARRTAAVAEHERVLHQALERALSEARLDARRHVLNAREQLLDRIFSEARNRLGRPQTLDRLAAHAGRRLQVAIACFPEAEALTIRCSPALVTLLETEFAGRRPVTVHPESSMVGFDVQSADGTVHVDVTLDARLASRRTELARLALRHLELSP